MPNLGAGRWDRSLRRFFDVKGEGISPELATEIVPVVTVQPDSHEIWFLREQRSYFVSFALSGEVADGNVGELRLEPGSNVIVTLEDMVLSGAGGFSFDVYWGLADPGGAGGSVASRQINLRDSRDNPASADSSIQHSTLTAVQSLGQVVTNPVAGDGIAIVSNGMSVVVPLGITFIAPAAFYVYLDGTGGAGQFLTARAVPRWHQRVAEPGELSAK